MEKSYIVHYCDIYIEKSEVQLLKKLLLIISTIIAALSAFTIFTPYPASWFTRMLFKGGVAVQPNNYDSIASKVSQQTDILYDSAFKSNTLDIISPTNAQEKLPVIIWVHGGAFVAGDKSDITEYAVQIAAQGYHVVNMNYELAPSAKYPTPLLQLQEVFTFVQKNAEQCGFDMNNVFFAGDSAGAQIVAQFANIQTDNQYASLIGIEQSVPAHNIRGLLLYCGPYDISKLHQMSDNRVIAFLLKRVGWGYLGEQNWQTSDIAKEASPIDYVTTNFPPSFITDGTVITFDDHGKALVERLEQLNVDVTSKFYEDVELPHEFQFMMDRPEAQEILELTLDFIQQKRK